MYPDLARVFFRSRGAFHRNVKRPEKKPSYDILTPQCSRQIIHTQKNISDDNSIPVLINCYWSVAYSLYPRAAYLPLVYRIDVEWTQIWGLGGVSQKSSRISLVDEGL